MTVLCVILATCLKELLDGHAAVVVPCVILALLCGVCVVIIVRQPESKEALTFKVTDQTVHNGPFVLQKRDFSVLSLSKVSSLFWHYYTTGELELHKMPTYLLCFTLFPDSLT